MKKVISITYILYLILLYETNELIIKLNLKTCLHKLNLPTIFPCALNKRSKRSTHSNEIRQSQKHICNMHVFFSPYFIKGNILRQFI